MTFWCVCSPGVVQLVAVDATFTSAKITTIKRRA